MPVAGAVLGSIGRDPGLLPANRTQVASIAGLPLVTGRGPAAAKLVAAMRRKAKRMVRCMTYSLPIVVNDDEVLSVKLCLCVNDTGQYGCRRRQFFVMPKN